MTTRTIELEDAKISLDQLLSLVAAGTEVILLEDNTPVARVVPITSSSTVRIAGLHPGAITTGDDFDEPLPDELWTGEA